MPSSLMAVIRVWTCQADTTMVKLFFISTSIQSKRFFSISIYVIIQLEITLNSVYHSVTP